MKTAQPYLKSAQATTGLNPPTWVSLRTRGRPDPATPPEHYELTTAKASTAPSFVGSQSRARCFKVQNDAERKAFREALLRIKKELSRIHVLLRRKGRSLRSRGADNPLL